MIFMRIFCASIQIISPLRDDSRWSERNVDIGTSEIGSPAFGNTMVVPARAFVNHVSKATVAGPESSCSPKTSSASRFSRCMNVRARFQRRSRSEIEKVGTAMVIEYRD